MNRKLLLLFLVFGFLALPGSAFAQVFDIKLSGDQEVPTTDSQATGECLAYLNNAQTQLTVICQHDVANPVAAHIHRAPAGENGSVILPFNYASSPFKATFSVSNQDVADLLAGNLYVNVHSPEFPDGEIRGQIGPAASGGVYFPLEGDQEVPPVDTTSTGSCIGVLNPVRSMFKLACQNDLEDVTDAGIYRGMEGDTGPLVFSLNAATTAFASVSAGDLDACPGLPGFLDDLWYGNLYVNVASSANPDGELRGQLSTPQLTLYFPQFGNGMESGSTVTEGFTSSIVLVNTSTTTEASGSVSLFDLDGNPLPVTLTGGGIVGPVEPQSQFSFTLAPLGAATLTTDGQGDLVLGSAEVQSNVPLGGIVRFKIPGIGIAGFGASPPMVRATVPVRQEGTLNTAVAIRNDESWPIMVHLELLGEDGQVPEGVDPDLNTQDIMIPAKGRKAKFINEYFEDLDLQGFTGTLMISTQDGSFSAIALELGVTPGLFTSLPVSPVVGP